MKQALFVTNPPPGQTLDGAGVCQIRAMSPGLAADRLQALLPLAKFAPPLGDPDNAFKPARLALLRTPETGRCVFHSAICKAAPPGSFSGFDVQTEDSAKGPTAPPRLGLTHVLLDLPTMVDPQQVLHSWGSDQWQQHDLAPMAEMGDSLFVPVGGHLSEEALAKFLKEAGGRDLFEFLLAAYLSTPAEAPIFLAAPPEQVALAVFALTKALPLSILENLTFSTYEAAPTEAKCRIVGANRDLPPACYDGLGVGINTFSGTKTGVNTQMPFVRFAVDNLVSGKPTALNEFHATWQRLGAKDLGTLDLVYRMSSGSGKLTKEEAQRAMQDQALAAWVATHPDALPQLLQWALDDVDYATATFSRAIGALRQKPDVLTKLGLIVQDEGMSALKAGQLSRTRNALEVVLPMVAPAKAASLWPDLFKELSQPDSLPWEVRGYLLPRLARLKPLPLNQEPDAQLRAWLNVPLDHLPNFLTVEVPQSYHLAGLVQAEGKQGATPALAKAIAGQPMLALPLLAQLASKQNGETRSLALFESILSESPRNWLEDLARSGRSLPTSLLDRCMSAALQQGAPDLRALVRSQGPTLIDLLGGKKSLDRLAAMLLEQPGAELLADEGVSDFLEKLFAQPGLSEPVWKRLDAFLAVRTFLKHPSLHLEELARVASALSQEPPLFDTTTTNRNAAGHGDQIAKGGTDIQQDLENVTLTVGPRYPGGSTPLYRALLRHVEQGKGFWRNEELLHAFVALSLDAAKAEKVNEELNGLDPEAAQLVYGIKKHGGTKLLETIDARTANWPRSARRQWVFLTQSAQLSGGGKSPLREAILFVAGIALTVAVFCALRFLGYL